MPWATPPCLANRQHRIDQPSVIVDREIALEAYRSGFRVDLGGVTAIGKREDVRVVVGVGVEPWGHSVGQIGGVAGRLRQCHGADAAFAPADSEAPGAEVDLARIGLQQVRGNRVGL
jgi:hypothetical protein